MRAAWAGVAAMLCACSGAAHPGGPGSTGAGGSSGSELGGGTGGSLVNGGASSGSSGTSGGSQDAPDAGPPRFQAGFHAAVRFSESATEFDTFAMRVRVARSGTQLRATLRAGDGTMQLKRVFVGHVDASGAVSGPLVQLPTGTGLSASHHGYLSTDAAPFVVTAGDELVVQFEAQGDLAASTIDLFPGSAYVWGERADDPSVLAAGTAHAYLAGLTELDVFGPATRAAIAIGDSITEGYVSGSDDIRNAWSSVASAQLGWPVVNAGVSGQGVWEEQQALSDEVLRAVGITDCVVLLGTNDLGGTPVDLIEGRLQQMWTDLQPFCTVHAVTLLPKETCGCDHYDRVKADRAAVNAFIRAQGPNVIDAEAAMRAPASADLYGPGLGEDGVHPSIQGQRVLGQAIAAALAK